MENTNEELVSRALYKQIKAKNRSEMEIFVKKVYNMGLEAAKTQSIDYDSLRTELSKIKGVGESRLNEIMTVIEKHMQTHDEKDDQP